MALIEGSGWREEERGYETPCWIWIAYVDPNGYGRAKRANGERTTAHRAVWERLRGPLPKVCRLEHRCGTRACVNPEHMRVLEPWQEEIRGYETPCWIWGGPIDHSGYGKGTGQNGQGTTAHRAIWWRLVGPIRPGIVLHHLCAASLCVRPSHMELVTRAEHKLRHKRYKRPAARPNPMYKSHSLLSLHFVVNSRRERSKGWRSRSWGCDRKGVGLLACRENAICDFTFHREVAIAVHFLRRSLL